MKNTSRLLLPHIAGKEHLPFRFRCTTEKYCWTDKLAVRFKYLLLRILALSFFGGNGLPASLQPHLQWAKLIGGAGFQDVKATATDLAGNVYVLGSFDDTTDFDPGENRFHLTGTGDFLCKLDPQGNFNWVKQLTDRRQNSIGFSFLAVDAAFNLYTAGNFGDTADFDPSDQVYRVTAHGPNDMFICKFDHEGNFIWVRNIGNSYGYPSINALAVDGPGNVYTTGYFSDTVDFDPGPGFYYQSTKAGHGFHAYTAVLDSSGKFRWAKTLGGIWETDENFSGRAIAVDKAGLVYSTGTYALRRNMADPGSNTFMYLTKQDAAGDFLETKLQIGGNQPASFAAGNSIALDDSGNVFVSGQFSGSISFDAGSIAQLNTTNLFNAFVCKWNAEGAYQWSKGFGGSAWNVGQSIVANKQGETYSLVLNVSPNPENLVRRCYKLNRSGTVVWTDTVSCSSIAVDSFGAIITAGSFIGTRDLDPGEGVYNLIAQGRSDMFIAKWRTSVNLPVQLIYFTLRQSNIANHLNWQTAQEQNTTSFLIERSTDGNVFHNIGSVVAAGTSDGLKDYSFTDAQPLPGTSFYRLKMSDQDGSFTYSNIITVSRNNVTPMQLLPNPVKDVMQIRTKSKGPAVLQITDAVGRILKQQKIILQVNASFTVDVHQLPNGKYYLLVLQNGQKEVKAFLKQ